MGELDGRIALVTGGGRGVGRAISQRLAAGGATVAVNYRRDADAAMATVESIVADGGRAAAFAASVDRTDECERLAEEVIARFGAIDLLVCNAGVASRGLAVADTEWAELQRLMDVHAFGPHQLCRAVLPSMRTAERGDIVFVSSVATNRHPANGAPYNMAKAAMESLARTLAGEERRHGVRVNIVAPGLVETEMGVRLARAMVGDRSLADLRSLDAGSPFGRVCQPEDVAATVCSLVGPAGSYVTGQRIVVDGGAG